MVDLIDSATAILAQSNQRVDVAAQNIANISTPGYKRLSSFGAMMSQGDHAMQQNISIDMRRGRQMDTGSVYDLSISTDGFFCVRTPTGILYTRQGQFHRDADGRVLTAQGYALQVEGGGDLQLKDGPFQVQADGTVTESGEAVARIAVESVPDAQVNDAGAGVYFSAGAAGTGQLEAASLRQGALETSNVSLGDEMTPVMEAIHQAELGQKLTNVYDDLLGRVVTIFGQTGQG